MPSSTIPAIAVPAMVLTLPHMVRLDDIGVINCAAHSVRQWTGAVCAKPTNHVKAMSAPVSAILELRIATSFLLG
jgi:hypothetical protein